MLSRGEFHRFCRCRLVLCRFTDRRRDPKKPQAGVVAYRTFPSPLNPSGQRARHGKIETFASRREEWDFCGRCRLRVSERHLPWTACAIHYLLSAPVHEPLPNALFAPDSIRFASICLQTLTLRRVPRFWRLLLFRSKYLNLPHNSQPLRSCSPVPWKNHIPIVRHLSKQRTLLWQSARNSHRCARSGPAGSGVGRPRPANTRRAL